MINLDKSFQEVFNRIDNWISEASSWIIEAIDAECVNISIYGLLSGSSYIKLRDKLRNLKKGLINIKNSDSKFFLWCHIRHLNLLKKHPERITKADKRMFNDLAYVDIKFPVSKKNYCKVEQKISICNNVFCYKINLAYPVYVSDKKFEKCMAFLLILDENKSHYVYIKVFNRLMYNKTKNKNKKHICRYCLQCFSSEKVLQEHKV